MADQNDNTRVVTTFVDEQRTVLEHPECPPVDALCAAIRLAATNRGPGGVGDPHLMGYAAPGLAADVLHALQHTGWTLTRRGERAPTENDT